MPVLTSTLYMVTGGGLLAGGVVGGMWMGWVTADSRYGAAAAACTEVCLAAANYFSIAPPFFGLASPEFGQSREFQLRSSSPTLVHHNAATRNAAMHNAIFSHRNSYPFFFTASSL